MKGNHNLSLALVAILTIGAGDVAAQDENRRRGARGGIDVESVMSMRDRLELNDDQVGQLDGWRAERVAQRTEARARMDEMRSQLRAGQIERSEVMAYMEERRDALQGSQGESRARLESILNETQLGAYDGLVRERRAFARGRASAMRGGRDGVRSGRSGVRGNRGGARSGRPGFRGRTGRRGDGPGVRGGRGWSGDDGRFRRGPRGEGFGPGEDLGPGREFGPDPDLGPDTSFVPGSESGFEPEPVHDPNGVLEST